MLRSAKFDEKSGTVTLVIEVDKSMPEHPSGKSRTLGGHAGSFGFSVDGMAIQGGVNMFYSIPNHQRDMTKVTRYAEAQRQARNRS